MTPERWQQVDDLFQAAVALETSERERFLDSSCAGDDELRREVESLVVSDAQGVSFIDGPAFEAAADLLTDSQPVLCAGQVVAKYEVSRLIGRGGMGEVYLADDKRLKRKVALKLLPADYTSDRERLWRFQQEAQAASSLNHPSILTIHELREIEGRQVIVTEFVDGETLRERLTRGPLSPGEALEIAIEVAGALAVAHRAGITHRDIKPENIMLRPDGYVKVLDFGLAKLSERSEESSATEISESQSVSSLSLMGTVKYMSPEQAELLPVDARSDIFSLGVVIYEMLTGHVPFAGQRHADVVRFLLTDQAAEISRTSREIPLELRPVLAQMLRNDRTERYQTLADVLTDLKRLKRELDHEAESDKFTRVEVLKHPGRSAWRLAGVAAALAGILLIGIQFGRTRPDKIAPTATVRKSIAVLPFRSNGADPGDEYLRLGLADAVITKLTGLREVIVRPLAAVTKYSARDQDPIAIGRQLGVDVVLDGQIQRIGDNYRVTVQLWQVSDGSSLSSYTCDDTCARIFELQDSISQRAANALAIHLTLQEQQYLARRYTNNQEVYDAYLKGRFYWNKKTPENYEKSIEFFNQAITLDRNYAPAYAGISDAYVQLAWVDSQTSTELMAKGKAAALEALKLDDNLAEVHSSMAYVKLMYDWDWPSAKAEFERALSLKPNYSQALNHYSYALAMAGEFDQAMAMSKAELAMDPLSVTANFDLAAIYLYTQHTDEAIAQLQKVLEMDPAMPVTHHFLLNAFYQKGMLNEFVDKLIAVRSNPSISRGDWSAIGLAPEKIRPLYDRFGWEGFLRGELEALLESSKREDVSPKRIAAIYAMLGDSDKAMEWLEKTYQEHSKTIMTIKIDPRLARVRSDPRFKEMVKRIGLRN